MKATRHKKSLLLAKCDPNAARSVEDRDWDSIAPLGRELGSPDYEKLAEQDSEAFQSNLAHLIQICSKLAPARADLDEDERSDAFNVQVALAELGQRVSLEIAAEVWRHRSNSVMAGWLTGAETIQSAKKALFSYVQHAPPGGFRPESPGPAGYD